MSSIIRPARASGALSGLMRTPYRQGLKHFACSATQTRRPQTRLQLLTGSTTPVIYSTFHTSRHLRSDRSSEPPPTDFGALDVLGNTPVPSTSVDICMSSGFQLNNGARITDGSGVLLVGGEAFRWRPWELSSSSSPSARAQFRLLNKKGQYDIPPASLNLLAHLWPRPDLLVLGLGPENRPISPELRKAISALGMRVEVLDTRNAAAQFNLLATERGVDDVAAAMVPIGWIEGRGAGDGDENVLTHE